MFHRKLKQMGACMLAFTMVISIVQLPAKAADANVIEKGDNLTLPSGNAGDTVRFCADYEQIIGEDGKVYTPLEDKTVTGFFETTTSSGSTTKSAESTYTVRGEYPAEQGGNEKPAVIPELQEWHGKTGTFVVSVASKVIIADESLRDMAESFKEDYLEITGMELKEIKVGLKEDAKMCDFYFELTEEDKGLGKEGYTIDIDDAVSVEAEDAIGAYWATRTILQILKQNGSMPKGLVRDYPKYEIRGFSLDVGRKPFSLDTLYQFAKNMAWYKLNSFQVHLSDNLIFMEDYKTLENGNVTNGLERAKEETYAGFRLESDVLNTDQEYLESIGRLDLLNKSATSTDLYYTKDEFRTFVKYSRSIGVDIVPEFDMPAHALPFTRAFPQYRTKSETGGQHSYLIDELDLDNPETTTWAQSIWNDYFTGDDPVFDENTTIHIGTDEFHGNGGNESFRKFSDDMIAFVQSTGRKVRMWGSLSNKTGTTPVRSKDVQLNVWEPNAYSVPRDMYNAGFDIINTSVHEGLYVVPSGTGVRGTSYSDYLDPAHIYNNWSPNKFGSYTIPAGDDQMLGACFAVWHDNIDTRANGISQVDSFDRFFEALPYISAKIWGEVDFGYDEFTQLINETGTAPNTNMYGEVDFITNTVAEWNFDNTMTKDSSLNQFDLTGSSEVSLVDTNAGQKALQLNGGISYAETPLDQVGENAVIKMKVKMDADADTENSEQILCESKEPFGQEIGTYAIKASMKQTGKVGFSREGYDYSFDYALPKDGTWVELEFHSGMNTVALYVNGELIDNNPDIYYSNHDTMELSATITKNGAKKVATMLVPIGRIGSNTDSFKGQIEYVTVTGGKASSAEYAAVPHSEMTATACSVSTTSGDEGPINFAIDGNNNTYWHTDWSNDTTITDDHHWFKITLNNAKTISRLTYLPRQNSESGRILEYAIDVEKEGANGTLETETIVSHGTWENTTDLKTVEFDPVTVKSITLRVLASKTNQDGAHATIAELNLYEPFDAKSDLQETMNNCESDDYQKGNYTDQSWYAFQKAKEESKVILNNESSTETDYITACANLQKAVDNLVALDFMNDAAKTRYNLASTIVEAEEQLKVLEGTSAAATLQAALQAAKAAFEQEGETSDDLADLLSNLQDASDLDKVLGEAKATLSTAITDARKKLADTKGYTAASVKELQDAVTAANALLNKTNVTVKELEDEVAKLNKISLVKDNSGSGGDTSGLKDNDLFEANGMKYQVVKASDLTVKLVKGTDTAKLTIDTVKYNEKTYTIVEIGTNAFSGCKNKLKKVTIGANVTTIGKNAFKGCKKLANIIIKNNSKLKKVGGGAFKKTSSKIKIKLPKNLKKNKKIKKQLKKAGIKKGL